MLQFAVKAIYNENVEDLILLNSPSNRWPE